jgi:hypothetical protein
MGGGYCTYSFPFIVVNTSTLVVFKGVVIISRYSSLFYAKTLVLPLKDWVFRDRHMLSCLEDIFFRPMKRGCSCHNTLAFSTKI